MKPRGFLARSFQGRKIKWSVVQLSRFLNAAGDAPATFSAFAGDWVYC